MNLIVDDKNELREVSNPARGQFSPSLRIVARIISIALHPLFIPFYLTLFILLDQAWLFASLDSWNKGLMMIHTFVIYTLFPSIVVGLLKALGFIQSIELKTQRDRIIPYIACGVFYFWGWYVSRNMDIYPPEIIAFRQAVFIASSLGLLANINSKISMHTIAMGLVSVFLIGFSLRLGLSLGAYIAIALFLTGLVSTSRLIVSDHSQKEIYLGLFLGALSQLITFWMM